MKFINFKFANKFKRTTFKVSYPPNNSSAPSPPSATVTFSLANYLIDKMTTKNCHLKVHSLFSYIDY